MPVIKPITELRNTNEISELCHQQQEPIFITKNGFGDLVVMSIEAYDKLMSEKIIDRACLLYTSCRKEGFMVCLGETEQEKQQL